MGRYVGDEISELANKPVNRDIDIEDNDVGVFEHRDIGSSDEEGVSDVEENGEEKAHYTTVEKSKLRDDGIALEDAKYGGSVGSRQELYADGGVEDHLQGESEEESQSDAVSLKTDSEDELISESEDDSEDEVEEAEDAQYKRERLAKLIQQETESAVKKLSETTQRDAAKGLCILEQGKMFENIIDVRIKLQKAVNSANALPLTKESWKECGDSDTAKLIKKTQQLLEKVLGQMIDFRDEFQTTDHISQQTEVTGGTGKRSSSQLEKETDRLDRDLKEYRSAVLNKWSAKVLSASGSHALNSSKFKAINQPSDVQVENQLADSERLLKRTCLSRRNILPARFHEDLSNGRLTLLTKDKSQVADIQEDDIDVPANYDPRRKDNSALDTAENPYIFDDEDFYRVLLNDLVDRKILDAKSSNGGTANIAITSRSNNKLKKNVDTKASKGRKLNFTVQEPIANYEAPRDSSYKWSDEQIDEFFAGLLGQRIDFNENEDVAAGEGGNAAEVEAINNDDIQIFG